MLFRVRFLGIHVELFAGLSLPFAQRLVPFLRRIAGLPDLPAIAGVQVSTPQFNGELPQLVRAEGRAGLSPGEGSSGKDATKPL